MTFSVFGRIKQESYKISSANYVAASTHFHLIEQPITALDVPGFYLFGFFFTRSVVIWVSMLSVGHSVTQVPFARCFHEIKV